ncbi:MAG: hypothetical protein HY363_01835 [Candidatus Aenigmarchaeota archaeon]|nr:hypothetical protein [Candidatus Aenigmarchaeota archaeon]
MEKQRKELRCNCDGYFEEQIIQKEFYYPIMMCKKCGHRVFTVEQAKQYVRLDSIHEKLKRKRKIIRIGNALGVTLPKALENLGIKEGVLVSFQQLGKKSLKLVIG